MILNKDMKVLTGMWVYAKKRELDGNIRYKARWVAKGCSQKFGINYTDTFAPLARMTTIRVLLFLSVQFNLIAHQVDVSTAFLNGDLDHEIYMYPPMGFSDKFGRVCRLNKSLYGLKQSAKLWNDKLNEFIVSLNFRRSKLDSCIYIKKEK